MESEFIFSNEKGTKEIEEKVFRSSDTVKSYREMISAELDILGNASCKLNTLFLKLSNSVF